MIRFEIILAAYFLTGLFFGMRYSLAFVDMSNRYDEGKDVGDWQSLVEPIDPSKRRYVATFLFAFLLGAWPWLVAKMLARSGGFGGGLGNFG